MKMMTESLTELGIEFKVAGEHHHATENFVQINCPYCGGNFLMGINTIKSFARCWSCGMRNVLNVLVDVSGKTFSECKKALKDVDWRPSTKTYEPKGVLSIPSGVIPIQKAHRKYIKSRRLDPDVIESLWGVKGIGVHTLLPWRLWIPIPHKGQIVSWTTRSLSDKVTARYKTARPSEEARSHKQCLYGAEYCTHACIIHEGPLDVWATGPGAVCTFGLSYSRTQLLMMSKYLLRIVCFDSSDDAQKTASELCDTLMLFPGRTYNVVLDAKDAGEAKEKELKSLRKLLRH